MPHADAKSLQRFIAVGRSVFKLKSNKDFLYFSRKKKNIELPWHY